MWSAAACTPQAGLPPLYFATFRQGEAREARPSVADGSCGEHVPASTPNAQRQRAGDPGLPGRHTAVPRHRTPQTFLAQRCRSSEDLLKISGVGVDAAASERLADECFAVGVGAGHKAQALAQIRERDDGVRGARGNFPVGDIT